MVHIDIHCGRNGVMTTQAKREEKASSPADMTVCNQRVVTGS
jgi:hypothetical protein